MKEVIGKYNTAKVFTDIVDESSLKQVKTLCDQEFTSGQRIRLMPDIHAGAGCTIGTTMIIGDKIVPNLVGVDIGCGMETLCIKADSEVSKNFDAEKLDKIIRKNIPCGFEINKYPHEFTKEVDWKNIKGIFNEERAKRSIGTLGGGNHFIEADRDEEGNLYIVVHSGSRHAGLEIAGFYQKEAFKQLNAIDSKAIVEQLKAEGREQEINETLNKMKQNVVPKDLAYVSGELFDNYINDMKIMQHFASLNRKAMIQKIAVGLRIGEKDIFDQFTTIHNYIDTDSMILRKGAVSAKKGEKLLIPINMRDGSLICIGKGNKDWNYSAPHGAGRIMSRAEAKKKLSLEEFKNQMSDVWSSSVNEDTLDEAPMAYKNIEDIVSNIGDTVEVIKTIKPIYNFKASE